MKRERDKSMLVWLGRLEMMSEDRWARRVYDVEWNVVGKQKKSWKTKVGEKRGEHAGCGKRCRWMSGRTG